MKKEKRRMRARPGLHVWWLHQFTALRGRPVNPIDAEAHAAEVLARVGFPVFRALFAGAVLGFLAALFTP